MKVLVCGGREFHDAQYLETKLDELHDEHSFTLLIEGGAHGADSLAGKWADARGIKRRTYMADWESLGRKAGPIRNKQMLDEGEPDLVIAFPGGRGTDNMCAQAEAAGVLVLRVQATDSPR